MDSRCHAENAIHPLTDLERGACDAALHLSQHTKIELMPNVHINEAMELSGFHFEAAGCDFANVLPITTNLFDCIVAYEVTNELHESFNGKVLHILQNMAEYNEKLRTLVDELKANTTNVPAFSCMVGEEDDIQRGPVVLCEAHVRPPRVGRSVTAENRAISRVRSSSYEGFFGTQTFYCVLRVRAFS
jgi:hypothetical protein